VTRDEAVADALDAVVPPRAPREERALRGLDGVELDRGVVAPQIAAHPSEEAARALRVDEGADAAAHLLVDLRSRPEDLCRGVVELPGDPVASGIGRPDLLQLLQREIHVALAALGEDELRAVGAHDLLALLAHALGHDDGAGIALHRGHPRAGDACVARGALQHAHPELEIAAGLRALEHVEIDAVLEAARGAVPLHLDVEGGLHVGTDTVELHEGRASDGGGDGGQRASVAGPFGGRHRQRSLAFLLAGGDPARRSHPGTWLIWMPPIASPGGRTRRGAATRSRTWSTPSPSCPWSSPRERAGTTRWPPTWLDI